MDRHIRLRRLLLGSPTDYQSISRKQNSVSPLLCTFDLRRTNTNYRLRRASTKYYWMDAPSVPVITELDTILGIGRPQERIPCPSTRRPASKPFLLISWQNPAHPTASTSTTSWKRKTAYTISLSPILRKSALQTERFSRVPASISQTERYETNRSIIIGILHSGYAPCSGPKRLLSQEG